MAADFHEDDGECEVDRDGEDTGDNGGSEALRPEREQAERDADVAGVGVGGGCGFDGGVGEVFVAPPVVEEYGDEERGDGDFKGDDEAGLPERLPGVVDDDVDGERREREVNDEAVEFRDGGGRHDAGAPEHESDGDEDEDREDDVGDFEHGLRLVWLKIRVAGYRGIKKPPQDGMIPMVV